MRTSGWAALYRLEGLWLRYATLQNLILPLASASSGSTLGPPSAIKTCVISRARNLNTSLDQSCQMAKFDPFLSLDWARVEGVGAQAKERKGSNFAA